MTDKSSYDDIDYRSQYRKVERELNWFFNHSAAALGFKSSHSAFVSAVYGTSAPANQDPDPYTDGILRQVKKYRRIRSLLYRLPNNTRRALEACYNQEYRYPSDLTYLYGHKAGCALFNRQTASLDHLLKLCRKKIQSKLSDKEKQVMFLIGDETKKTWETIHQQYLSLQSK